MIARRATLAVLLVVALLWSPALTLEVHVVLRPATAAPVA